MQYRASDRDRETEIDRYRERLTRGRNRKTKTDRQPQTDGHTGQTDIRADRQTDNVRVRESWVVVYDQG